MVKVEMDNLKSRLFQASSEFFKTPDLDITLQLDTLTANGGEWKPFRLDKSGKTEYRVVHEAKEARIVAFRSQPGAHIPLHYHSFVERVCWLSGYGDLTIDRHKVVELKPMDTILIPARSLHEGRIHDEVSTCLCVFHYVDQNKIQ